MPMYEYLCRQCGHRFVVLTSWAEKDAVRCASCGSTDVTRLLSTFSCSRGTEGGGCGTGGTRGYG